VKAPGSAELKLRATRANPGFVSIVGAGPGDPGLLTRKALARLRTANLVLYDALVDLRLLDYARKARRFFVGKRAGRHAMAQETIHALMIRAARRGERVVRLKGGDPFVFGRGGEEALALRAAGVHFEVVPGVTSAVAAPACAGVPVTHRGLASAFLVVTGHDEAHFRSALDAVAPNSVTLVVLMGLARRAALAEILLGRGWRPDTPVALVVRASMEGESIWRGSLGDLARHDRAVDKDKEEGPGTIVVGEVAALDCRSLSMAREGGSRLQGGFVEASVDEVTHVCHG
jgi:uroporphyrin-III C-methyltransferase